MWFAYLNRRRKVVSFGSWSVGALLSGLCRSLAVDVCNSAFFFILLNTMSLNISDKRMTELVERLSTNNAMQKLYHEHRDGCPLPSGKVLGEIVDLMRAIVFPGYFGKSNIFLNSLRYPIGANVQQMRDLLEEQILAGLCFANASAASDHNRETEFVLLEEKRRQAEEMAWKVIERLPHLQSMLATDVEAAYNGDPAAENYGEIISCYPVIRVLTNYRLAHELYVSNVPYIPRMMTEYAHSGTGIDINPGATIGEYFFIDHGTGVVIGETTEIGNNVKLYQGVTLGALSTRKGQMLSNVKRHPTIGNNVTVYSNASILGGETVVGDNSTIGGGAFITSSVPENTRVQVGPTDSGNS